MSEDARPGGRPKGHPTLGASRKNVKPEYQWPIRKTRTFRLSAETFAKLTTLASKHVRTLSGEIEYLILKEAL